MANGAFFKGSSADGTHVFFQTFEALTSNDTDTSRDVYERYNGTTTLVSSGPQCCVNTSDGAFFSGSSADGTHVFFQTFEALTSNDTDTSRDVYERYNGTTTLVSTGPLCCQDTTDGAYFQGASADGSRVFFQASESLVSADTDGFKDVYERSGGTTTLVSIGPNGGNGPYDSFFDGASQNGTDVFFHTQDSLVSADTDGFKDVYERLAGVTTEVSVGPGGGNGPFDSFFQGSSVDGTHVFIDTSDKLTTDDLDSSQDVYDASAYGFYARPKGASPFRVSLIPAYLGCSSPNRSHAAPLAFGSCNPPIQTSSILTIGTPDANGAAANSIGSVRLVAIPGDPSTPADEADAQITTSLTDVRKKSDLADYAGELQTVLSVRLTDRQPSASGTEPETTQDFPFRVTVPCTVTIDVSIGSSCALTTTADTLMPGAVPEGRRSIWELDNVQVYDGGPDGIASTTGDNALFATQGVFVP